MATLFDHPLNTPCLHKTSSKLVPHPNGRLPRMTSSGNWSKTTRTTGHSSQAVSRREAYTHPVLIGGHPGSASRDGSVWKVCRLICPRHRTSRPIPAELRRQVDMYLLRLKRLNVELELMSKFLLAREPPSLSGSIVNEHSDTWLCWTRCGRTRRKEKLHYRSSNTSPIWLLCAR